MAQRFLVKTLILSVLAGGLSVGTTAHADDLVPATSDDLKDFDRQVQQQMERSGRPSAPSRPSLDSEKNKKKDRRSNFGSVVSVEAKKLNDSTQEQKREFGKWVSDQRKQSEEKTPQGNANGLENGRGNSASTEGQTSSPALNNSGGSPGKSGNRKK